MYLYFDKRGNLLEIVLDTSVRRGSVGFNHIYAYIDNESANHTLNPNLSVLGATYELISNTVDNNYQYLNSGDSLDPEGTITSEYLETTKITKKTPIKPDRDVKYFKENTDYQFFDLSIPSVVTSFSGTVALTLRAIFSPITDTNGNSIIDNNEVPVNANIMALGQAVFHIEVNDGLSITNAITYDQYNYLVQFITAQTAPIGTHIANTNNPHSVTKTQVGLGNVDNTSDNDKPISSATQAALNNKQNSTDNNLSTTNKTVVGGINELKSSVDQNTAARHTHSNKALLDTYEQTEANLADAVTKKHSHENKSVLDGITANDVLNWDSKQSALTVAQLNACNSGVTSSKVSTYDGYATSKQDTISFQNTIAAKYSVVSPTSLYFEGDNVEVVLDNLQGQIIDNGSDITSIKNKIPNAATSSNQLADKAFVNSSIENMASFRVKKRIGSGTTQDPYQYVSFSTKSELNTLTTVYINGVAKIPGKNDSAIVLSDESKQGTLAQAPTTRYSYPKSNTEPYDPTAWEFDYIVNNTGLTQAQVDALDSGINSIKVAEITANTNARHSHSNKALLDTYTQTENDIADAVAKKHTHSNKSVLDGIASSDITNWNNKQNAINDLSTIRTGAGLGATALQPSDIVALTNAEIDSIWEAN